MQMHESIKLRVVFYLRLAGLFLLPVMGSNVTAQPADLKVFLSVEQAVTSTAVKNGDYIKVLGYYHANDGGAAEYFVKRAEAADSSELVLKLAKGLNAILLTPQTVNYKMFGAKGDGENNDVVQIAKAHDYANKKNIPVVNSNGEFWLKAAKKVVIKTNVNWGKTVFHIDESFNTPSSTRFEIASDYKPENIILTPAEKSALLNAVKPGASLIPQLAKYKNHLVFIADARDKIGFRSGANFTGQSWSREEFFYVEENGRILGDIAWQFKDYTKLVAYRADENYLKVEGGTFYLSGNSPTTKSGSYLQNGIVVTRSRTIIANQWVGLEPGAADTSTLNPRRGFYSFTSVYDVKLENIRLIPYEQNRGIEARNVTSGTYGISMGRVLDCTFKNVTAEGSLVHWGVFGSNLVKNFNVENCRLNRVDVHFHCWNLKITDSEIGFKGITITGGGKLIIENSSCAARSFVGFRSDFGSKWDGDIKISNSTFKVSSEDKAISVLAFAPRDFDYKYPVGFGRSLIVENFTVDFSAVNNKDATCWLMRVPPFAQMKVGQRLFLPEQLRFENIRVAGREKGLRLFEIKDAASYGLSRPGNNDHGLVPNANFSFENIQLEDLKNEPPSTNHFSLTAINPYKDRAGLYPKIKFSNCNNLVVKSTGIADFSVEDCNVAGFNSDSGTLIQGRLVFTRCNFYPAIKDNMQSIYNLSSLGGTSFTDCKIFAPVLKDKMRPDLFDKNGIVTINKTVRFNHTNTLLGSDILNYYRGKGITLSPKFISMLKSHHELETENVQ